jgi:hypothetical protein
MYANKMNKIGDSYLPCIAMAHSPPSLSDSSWGMLRFVGHMVKKVILFVGDKATL